MSYPPAGSIKHHIDQWVNIDASLTVIDWIRNGIRIPFSDPLVPFHFRNRAFSPAEVNFIDSEIVRLLHCGAIELCSTPPRYISPLHCVPKKNGGHRLILNLRYLNGHVRACHFRNDDIRVVAEFVDNEDYLVSADIKNGFYHVPVHVEDREYLSFAWRGAYYQFTVTPFGLRVSPYYFCKILRPVIAYLREQGLRVSVYVDDFCLAAPRALITDHCDLLVHTLADLGIHVNFEKSQLSSSRCLDYLGYTIRVGNEDGFPFIAAQSRRVKQLQRDIKRALNKPLITARTLARIAGQCISIAWCVEPAKLLLRGVYRLLSTRSTWESTLVFDNDTREDLRWWQNAVQFWNGKSICHRPISAQVITDASHLAWGAVLGHHHAGGDWSLATSRRSSNYRELLAILLALKSFLPQLASKSVQILTDNVTALAYVQHKGGPSRVLTSIARAIWTLAVENGISINCKHIAGKDNVIADRLSRLPDKHDWRLHPRIFMYLDSLWGPHTIDRFASYLNCQLPVYNSRFADPHSSGIDALAQTNWGQHNNYVNPPFCLLQQVLDVICHQQAVATVIAPYWRAQPYLARLKHLSIRPPILLPATPHLFQRMGVLPEPLRNPHWRIYAWRICGRVD